MQIKIDYVKSTKYYEHWEKTRNIETEIYEMKKKFRIYLIMNFFSFNFYFLFIYFIYLF